MWGFAISIVIYNLSVVYFLWGNASPSIAQVSQLPPVDFGLVVGMAISSGNPALRSSAFFLEGNTDIPVTGPFAFMLTAGSIFSEKNQTPHSI